MVKLFNRNKPDGPDVDDKNPPPCLNEFLKTANVISERLRKQIEVLEAIEASVDKKLDTFERLVNTANTLHTGGERGFLDRRREVVALTERGFDTNEIADVLGINGGEVELILNLHG
jgi:DNA-binding NarL/FixJ family response regulator